MHHLVARRKELDKKEWNEWLTPQEAKEYRQTQRKMWVLTIYEPRLCNQDERKQKKGMEWANELGLFN